jgi:peptidyl-Lys metalloendopeptidase
MRKLSSVRIACKALLAWAVLTTGCAVTDGQEFGGQEFDEQEFEDSHVTDGEQIAKAAAAQFPNCSPAHQKMIQEAIPGARQMLQAAVTHLQNNPAGSTLFTKWFGAYQKDRHQQVRANMERLWAKFRQVSTIYHCHPEEEGYWGWSYGANYPNHVYLGGSFFKAEGWRKPWRSSTIVHELSHGWLSTKHYDSSPQELARRQPSLAIQCADNYEEFCFDAQ